MADETVSVDWSNARARAAFEEVAPEAAALAPERVLRVNLDVPKATGTVRTKLPGLLELRSEIAKHMPLFGLARLERLGTYALALLYANGGHLAASAPVRPLPSWPSSTASSGRRSSGASGCGSRPAPR